MKDVYYAELCGHWYLFERPAVKRVIPMAEAPEPTARMGQSWFSLDEGNAELCPLRLLFTWATPDFKEDHYLVLFHHGRLLALPMRGPGREGMALLHALQPLPPAFPALARRIVPGMLLNGREVIMRLDLDELARAMDKIALLRKKKLESRRKAGV